MQEAQSHRINQLVRFAHETMRAGKPEESVRVWEQVRAIAPDHPQALFHLGLYALFRKDAGRARALLEQAEKADPAAPAISLNLSYALRALGDSGGEYAALTRALTIDPLYFPALLAKGMFLERGGSVRAAAKTYKTALANVPPEDQIAPETREHVAHARRIVDENATALQSYLELSLAEIRSRYESIDLDRFEECKDIALGLKKVYTQQASTLLVPRLPAIQFYPDGEFPWMADLEAATADIREEFLSVMRESENDFVPYMNRPDDEPLNRGQELNRSQRWRTYFLWKDGKRFDEACRRCPRTAAASEALPLMNAANYGPTIMFSVLAPHTDIPSHTSSTNARLIVHLPLVVPEGCQFRVGNETRSWKEGKAWVFDDTIEHEAQNNSDQYRTILMIDIWNPLLSMPERELIGALLNGIKDYYRG